MVTAIQDVLNTQVEVWSGSNPWNHYNEKMV